MVSGVSHRATADDTEGVAKPGSAEPSRHRPAYVEPPPPSILPYVGGGIALIGAAGATVFFLEARRAHAAADGRYPTDPAFATDRSRFRVERALGCGFTAVGALGAALLVHAWLSPPRAPALRVGVGPTDGGALVVVGGAL